MTQSPMHPGFLGPGHTASAVFEGTSYEETDPFILFMDDRVDYKGGAPAGGPHPHAGFETLTLVLKGNGGDWEEGSFELMTAGKGIVHTEEMSTPQQLHILQVWLALAPDKRFIQPSWQKLKLENVPIIKTDSYEIRVYSGSSNGLSSPMQNHTPLTVVDFSMQANQTLSQKLPANQSGLVYVLEGGVQIGDKTIKAGQAGWLNKSDDAGTSELNFQSQNETARFVLYAAQPHHAPVVSHGPFIADTMEDISRLYREYRNGGIPHLRDLAKEQKEEYTS